MTHRGPFQPLPFCEKFLSPQASPHSQPAHTGRGMERFLWPAGLSASRLLDPCSSAGRGQLEVALDFIATSENVSSTFFSSSIQNTAATGWKIHSVPAKTRTTADPDWPKGYSAPPARYLNWGESAGGHHGSGSGWASVSGW